MNTVVVHVSVAVAISSTYSPGGRRRLSRNTAFTNADGNLQMTGSSRVVGVGMVPFTTPSRSMPYDVMAAGYIARAIQDSGIDYSDVQQAYAGYVYGDSACGQTALYRVGMTGVPILNVNNYSSGSSALWLARQAIESGVSDCVLALGFEQMPKGAPKSQWADRPSAFTRVDEISRIFHPGGVEAPATARAFGAAADQYSNKYDTKPSTFAAVAVKARKHAAHNPYATFVSRRHLMRSWNRRR